MVRFVIFPVSLTIICLVGKFKKAILDYALVLLLTVRVIEKFILLHLVQNKVAGFELIDLKELSNSIPNIAVPAFALACCNFKFDVLFTAPMTLLSIFMLNERALTTENGNLSCFLEPQAYSIRKSIDWSTYLVFQLIIAYMLRKTTLERFCEQEKSTKQQTQLKSLFDNQPDGVLILSYLDASIQLPPVSNPLPKKRDLNYIDPNVSASRLDSSFPSFVNPTETDGQEDSNMELVFHNEALLRIVGKRTTKDLHALVAKRIFVSCEQNNRLSLLNAA